MSFLLLLFGCLKDVDKSNENNQTMNLTWFYKKITDYEKVISQSWCKAGESYYLWLSQYYKYTHQYKKSLDILKDLADCYPAAYKEKTIKLKLLLHNIWAVYEEWARYLKQKGDKHYKEKYQKAKEAFQNIIDIFSWTKLLSEDEIRWYKERIKWY